MIFNLFISILFLFSCEFYSTIDLNKNEKGIDTTFSNKDCFFNNFKEITLEKNEKSNEIENIVTIETDNNKILFSDSSNLEEAYEYTYLGYNKKSDCFIVEANFWEGSEIYLIDKKTSKIDTLWNVPYFNSDGTFLACKSLEFGMEGEPNGIQIWKRNEINDWVKLKELNQSEWVPLRLAWCDNDIIIESVLISDFQTNNINSSSKKYNKVQIQ
jgi:hypothetical protein